MKRCPQCLFIYPDSDQRCDFDNTALIVVDEAELEEATNSVATPAVSTSAPPVGGRRQRKLLLIAATAGLALSILLFVVYLSLSNRAQRSSEVSAIIPRPTQSSVAPWSPVVSASPTPIATQSSSPSASAALRTSPDRFATSRSGANATPVSTSGPGMGKRPGGKPVILLTTGGKIDADEVWRTRDGVWYRRSGIVTLLKPGRVKAIVNQ